MCGGGGGGGGGSDVICRYWWGLWEEVVRIVNIGGVSGREWYDLQILVVLQGGSGRN